MWQYSILETGYFHADGGAMFGAIPKRAWSRRFPADETNCCVLAMNCVLVQNGERTVLLDTGVGTKGLDKLAYYRFFNNRGIVALLKEKGISPEQITDVVLSHLHFDHCGGCTYETENQKLGITFSNACHYVGKEQWQNYLQPNDLEKDSFRLQDMRPIYEAGLLELIEHDLELFPGFFLELHDGHTVGQLVSLFQTEDKRIVFPGDVIPTQAHLSDEWISAYDTHPLDSLAAKKRLKQQAGEMIFYHGH